MSGRIKGAAIGALLLLVACSLLANLFLFSGWQGEKSRADKAAADLVTANGQTEACNKSIAGLEDAAFKRGASAERARETAKRKAADLERQAQTELSTPATTPGNDCKSAQDRVDRILRQRAEKAKP